MFKSIWNISDTSAEKCMTFQDKSGDYHQADFREFLRALEKTKESMSEEKYKLNILAQTADNIGNLYRRTEMTIEDGFEPQRLKHGWTSTGTVDLSKLGSRVNSLLYGDEKR